MELNDDHIRVLGKMADAFINDGNGMVVPFGWRSRKLYLGISSHATCAHLLERGLIITSHKYGGMCYRITPAGLREVENWFKPPDETAEILATIARLESELAAARARLARPDGLHEGG